MSDLTIQGPYDKVLDMLNRARDEYYVIGFVGDSRDFVKLYLTNSLESTTKSATEKMEEQFRTFFKDESLMRFSGKFKEVYPIIIGLVDSGYFIEKLDASIKVINVSLTKTYCDQHKELLADLDDRRKEGNTARRGARRKK